MGDSSTAVKGVVAIVGAAAAVVHLSVLYMWLLLFSGFANGHTLVEMDWNADGRTSFREMLEAEGIWQKRAGACIEYFSTKDGYTNVTRCQTVDAAGHTVIVVTVLRN